MVQFPELGSRSCYFGVFICIMSECGGNMDAKNKLFSISLPRSSQQHIDCCLQYLSDKAAQRKQYSDSTTVTFVKVSYHRASVYCSPPCFSIKWRQLCNLCTNIFSNSEGIHMNFPSQKNVYSIFLTAHERTFWLTNIEAAVVQTRLLNTEQRITGLQGFHIPGFSGFSLHMMKFPTSNYMKLFHHNGAQQVTMKTSLPKSKKFVGDNWEVWQLESLQLEELFLLF